MVQIRTPFEKEKLGEQSGVKPDHDEIVSQVVEMGDATFCFGEVAHGHGKLAGTKAEPGHAHGDFLIKIIATGKAGLGEGGDHAVERAEPHTEEGIAKLGTGSLDVGEPDADFATLESDEGCFGAEDGFAHDDCIRVGGTSGAKLVNPVGGVLSVRIHAEHMGEASFFGGCQSVKNGLALATIVGADKKSQVIGILIEQGGGGAPRWCLLNHQ